MISILSALIKNKDALSASDSGVGERLLLENIVSKALVESSLATPITTANNGRMQDMDIALRLTDIMKNPTEDQKLILDTVTALLNDVNKAGGQAASPELKKATDDLLQMVASLLLAQAIPDLLKEGDISNIKNIFSELDATKGKFMQDYKQATKPYYAKVKEMLANNLVILQLNNVLSNSATKEELDRLPPDEVDKLLEKMRKAANRSGEEEYILKQEAEYRKLYLDPNRKAFEDNIKAALQEFTKKLNNVLK